MDRLPREENMQEILKKKTELKNDFSRVWLRPDHLRQ